MRGKAHIGGIRNVPVTPGRRVLVLALSLLMLLASLPMDVTAAVIDRFTAPRVARLGGQDFAEPRVTEYSYDEIGARSLVRRWNGVETEYGYDILAVWSRWSTVTRTGPPSPRSPTPTRPTGGVRPPSRKPRRGRP